MDEDYESAKKLLEDLRKKYSTKDANGASNRNKNNIVNKPPVSAIQTLEELKNKYSTKNTSEGSTNEDSPDKPLTCVVRTQKKGRRNKTKEGGSASTNEDSPDKPSTCVVQTQKGKRNKTKGGGTATKLPKSSSNNKNGVVTAIIDTTIPNKYGLEVTEKLQESQIFYKYTDQIYSGLITWIRSSSNQNSDKQDDAMEAVIIINWQDTISYIKSSQLFSHIKSLQEILVGRRIFLGLYGIENYFRYWKLHRGGNVSKADGKRLAEYTGCIKINRGDFETSLAELQLACNCCYRLLNSPQDIVDLILQFTKSVTQLPEKLEKSEKYKYYEWHMLKDNRDCVPVDKNGNGLQRLWQQQLTTFEMARLETAEAVIAQYSTPSKLYEAYKYCSESEGQKLLEDIPIRRSAGPLTSSRKVGPELSSKVYTFFNSVDGHVVL